MADPVAMSRSEATKRDTRDGLDVEQSPLSRSVIADSVRRGPETSRGAKRPVIKSSNGKVGDRQHQEKRVGLSFKKPERVHDVIWTAVQSHFLFRHLDAAMHRELVDRMIPVPAMPGQDVIKQGDKGDYFYVAESGTFEVIVNDEKVHTYQAGDVRGCLIRTRNPGQ